MPSSYPPLKDHRSLSLSLYLSLPIPQPEHISPHQREASPRRESSFFLHFTVMNTKKHGRMQGLRWIDFRQNIKCTRSARTTALIRNTLFTLRCRFVSCRIQGIIERWVNGPRFVLRPSVSLFNTAILQSFTYLRKNEKRRCWRHYYLLQLRVYKRVIRKSSGTIIRLSQNFHSEQLCALYL